MQLLRERSKTGDKPPTDAEALIREARRLRRRRWEIGSVLVVAVGVVIGLVLTNDANPGTSSRGTGSRVPSVASNATGLTATVVPEQPTADAIAPSGELYVADAARYEILRRLSDGKFAIAVGSGHAGFAGDGGRAANASLATTESMLFAPNGTFYLAEEATGQAVQVSGAEAAIRAVSPRGVITTVVGGGRACQVAAAGTPARSMDFTSISALGFSPQGVLAFVAQTCAAGNGSLFQLDSDGDVVQVTLPQTASVQQCGPSAFAYSTGGDLYLACFDGKDVLVIAHDEIVNTFADTYPYDEFGGLVAAPDGKVIAGDFMKVDTLTSVGKTAIVNLAVGSALARTLGTISIDGRTISNSIEPNGIAVNKAGDIFVAATSGLGNGDMTAIIEVEPDGHIRVLWRAVRQ